MNEFTILYGTKYLRNRKIINCDLESAIYEVIKMKEKYDYVRLIDFMNNTVCEYINEDKKNEN